MEPSHLAVMQRNPHTKENMTMRGHTHTHEHFHKLVHTFGFKIHHTCKKKSTNKDIFEQEQKKFLK